jgi:hypothetical protein
MRGFFSEVHMVRGRAFHPRAHRVGARLHPPASPRGFETPREGAPAWAREALAAARAGQLGETGGVAPRVRPHLGAVGLLGELALFAAACVFLSASAGGGMGIILLGLIALGFSVTLAASRLYEYRFVARTHPGRGGRPAFALVSRGIALAQDGRVVALAWSDVLEIVALPPRGLGRHGPSLVFVVSPQRRSPPWVEILPTRFGLNLWDLLPEAERLRAAQRRQLAAVSETSRAPYRVAGREELGSRALALADNVAALADAMLAASPLPGCFPVPGGSFHGNLMLTPSALVYVDRRKVRFGALRLPSLRRVPWSEVAELDAEGGSLRVRMREPDDDLCLRGLEYPALLVAAVASAYLRGAAPLARI